MPFLYMCKSFFLHINELMSLIFIFDMSVYRDVILWHLSKCLSNFMYMIVCEHFPVTLEQYEDFNQSCQVCLSYSDVQSAVYGGQGHIM